MSRSDLHRLVRAACDEAVVGVDQSHGAEAVWRLAFEEPPLVPVTRLQARVHWRRHLLVASLAGVGVCAAVALSWTAGQPGEESVRLSEEQAAAPEARNRGMDLYQTQLDLLGDAAAFPVESPPDVEFVLLGVTPKGEVLRVQHKRHQVVVCSWQDCVPDLTPLRVVDVSGRDFWIGYRGIGKFSADYEALSAELERYWLTVSLSSLAPDWLTTVSDGSARPPEDQG